MTTKTCSICHIEKPLSDFAKHRGHADGLQSGCRQCYKAYLRHWGATPKGKESRLATSRKRRYGVTRTDIENLTAEHKGQCAICGVKASLHIDHDHRSDQVRGLLCGNCNRALGLFDDDPYVLGRAQQYLLRYRQIAA